MAAVRTIKPRKIKRPGLHEDPSWADVQDYFSGPVPPADHMKALRETGWLSNVQRRMYNGDAMQIDPEDVIKALNRAGVTFVLMGAHVNNAWTRVERATRDVDVLIQKSHHRKAVEAIQNSYPTLRVRDLPVVTRFIDPSDEKARIDLMKPNEAIHKAALKNTIAVGRTHRVPDLEMAITCKFAAMVSPNREINRKRQDAVDFSLLVTHNKAAIKRNRLREFGELVYSGGGAEIAKLVDDIVEGREIVI